MPRVQRKQESRFKSPLPICSNSHKNLGVFLPQTHGIQMTLNLHIKSKDLLDMSDVQISKNRRPKWANALFLEIKHPSALILKLNREMPLFCNSRILKSSYMKYSILL